MAYGDEDEIDWSDCSLHALPPPSLIKVEAGPSYPDQHAQAGHDLDLMFKPEIDEEHIVPFRLPIEPGLLNSNSTPQGPSRSKQAPHDVHPSRRIPSKKDYSNFILYQASQKAYEVTFLNAFLAHALHPEQIAQCSGEANHARPTIEEYLRTVSRDIDQITKKIVWNAHCRTVHLLANDRKHGAPFLDVHTISPEPFSDYGPDNLFPIADRMRKSWHHVNENPSMVRYSTGDYHLAHGIGPLEELDEVTNTLLCRGNSNKILPAGRAVRLPTFKKRKGEHSCGAAVREEPVLAPRMNWLTFPQQSSVPVVKGPATEQIHESHIRNSVQVSPRLSASHHVQDGGPPAGPFVECAECQNDTARSCPSHLEEVSGCYGDSIFDSDVANPPAPTDDIAYMEKPTSGRSKLIEDHKKRLVRKWGHSLPNSNVAAMSTGETVTAAIALGFCPTNSGYAEKVATTAAEDSQQTRGVYFHQVDGAEDANATPPGAQRPVKRRRIMGGAAAGGQHTATASTKQNTVLHKSINKSSLNLRRQAPHPSGSWTLEEHQEIPPNAYFEPKSIDEKPAWLCGIKHALGCYYNSGDCKSCKGCNTNVRDSPMRVMDFYMPLRTFYCQPVPDNRWKPSKPFKTARKASSRCHNAIAKDAYWSAIGAGATHDDAWQVAVDTVTEWLKPKPLPKMTTPEPEPEPEPEPDLGPHVSGSTTMEHGQDIPQGYYWQRKERHEEYAWRCDVSHAFGRYYLAGDKKSCPGCGSSHKGNGRRATMDFYLPMGVTVRQDAPGLSIWKPHALKPDKVFKSKNSLVTHNQMCSKAYHDKIAQGYGEEEALKLAVEEVDKELDRRQEEKEKRKERRGYQEMSHVPEDMTTTNSSPVRNLSVNTDRPGSPDTFQYTGNSSRWSEMTPVSNKRRVDDMSDSEMDGADVYGYQTSGYASSAQMPGNVDETSSEDDEESSGSYSE